MKPTLVAYNPYLRGMGGGEKYFSAILAVLQEHFYIKLISPCLDMDLISEINNRFNVDLSYVDVLSQAPSSIAKLQCMVPSDAVFFQVTNNVPLPVTCRKKFLHYQVVFPRLDEEDTKQRYPQHSPHVINNAIGKRFAEQDHVFFPSNYVRDSMLPHWPVLTTNSSVIYPPVDDIFYSSDPPEKSGIISVGRFVQIKQQAAQIKLIRSLYKDLHEDCKLTIIGSSKTRIVDYLMEEARQLPVDIRYGLDQVALRKEYEGAALFWSTTGLSIGISEREQRVEAFGLAIAESMACGCVPVVIKGGGVTEIIDSGHDGYLVKSLLEMGEVTKHLLLHHDELVCMSERSKEKAKAYSMQVFAKKILNLFLKDL